MPQFSGEPRKYKAFKNLFNSIMESSSSSEILRIYYLKGCLKEQALRSWTGFYLLSPKSAPPSYTYL
ncbi:DUF1759 domain-containing protein [Klebsiella pneumoniae]|uniref:DUF1759 domain-containing protein n=1 Tax=Klebsiella pneumoniae TaxID=573 RepID=UPI0040553672